ncbi:MAG: iron-containing alcohol dehydrogenase [Clostridia bacterium]|nr:iron-containing alcohol dehydrogenase [Clostridia bacterium]
MKTLKIDVGPQGSLICCGEGSFENFASTLGYDSIFLVTDTNVARIYSRLIEKSFPSLLGKYVMKAGEASKTPRVLFDILGAMAKAGLNRGSLVIAMGGGVVGDIGGLAASLYMRGVHLCQVATTLLSQVDSSVGGKTAVDMGKIKNAVGTFYQPETVIVDPMFLATLPFREMRCGMGEIVKYAAIDRGIYDKVSSAEDIFDRAFIEDVTYDCIAFKAKVVEADEKDTNGERAFLNAGHTVGHAIELFYGLRSHGQCVAMGLYFEMYMALRAGECEPKFYEEFGKILGKVTGPMPKLYRISKITKIAGHDKKNSGRGKIDIIAPCGRGVSKRISVEESEFSGCLSEAERALRQKEPVRLALIGRDVSKSTSDKIHEFICEKLGYDAVYDKVSVPEDEFEDKIERVMEEYDGFNVTIPYKLTILTHIKKLVGDAEVFGAVNTVITGPREGRNTDGDGFMLMLKNAGVDAEGRSVLLIGSGGAGRSVAKKLRDEGCLVDVYSIDRAGAEDLADKFGCVVLDSLTPRHYDIIINATGVGMHESEGVSPVERDVIRCCGVAVDLIYEPKESAFLTIAREEGLKTLNGEAMLFYQAYFSDCAYLGLEPRASTAKKLYIAYEKKS